jgi:hypothetical protein
MTDEGPIGDEEATAEEVVQAEALARALEEDEGRRVEGADDVLETAAFLHHVRAVQTGAAQPAAVAAPDGRTLAAVDARHPRLRWRWLIPALLVPAAVGLLLSTSMEWRTAPVAPLPVPPLALLQAQAQAAKGRADLAALDRLMRDYRASYYAALATHGGGDR